MVVSTRLTAPNYKIFEPDALDAIYAKGNLDPIMGGISYAFGSAHKQQGAMNQESYLVSQDKFNKMASALDAMEIDQKRREAVLKIAGKLIEEGEDPTLLQGGADIYSDPTQNLLPGLKRGVLQSTIGKNAATGAAAGKGARETETHEETGPTETGTYKITRKGPPGSFDKVSLPGNSTKPGSTPIVPAAASDQAKRQAIVKTATQLLGSDVAFKQNPDGSVIARSASTPGKQLEFNRDGVLKR